MELPEKLNPYQLGCDTPSPPCDMKWRLRLSASITDGDQCADELSIERIVHPISMQNDIASFLRTLPTMSSSLRKVSWACADVCRDEMTEMAIKRDAAKDFLCHGLLVAVMDEIERYMQLKHRRIHEMMSPGSVKKYDRHALRNEAVDVFLNEAVEQIRNAVSDNLSRSVLLNAINELRRLMVRDDKKNSDNGDETTFRNAITDAFGTYAAADDANQHEST